MEPLEDRRLLDAAAMEGYGLFPGQSYPLAVQGFEQKPASVALGDLNGDGRLDAVAADPTTDYVSVMVGLQGGTFGPAVEYFAGDSQVSVALGDIDGDGRLDIVTANPASNDVAVLLGRGDGTFGAVIMYSVGNSPQSVALGDLNGDGRLDIVSANYSSNNVSVLIQVEGGFAPQVAYDLGRSPTSVALGDVNGDGRLDIVTTLSSATSVVNYVSVSLGVGGGAFAAPVKYEFSSYYYTQDLRSVALGDLNGDGRLDIVAANYWTKKITVLVGTEDGFTVGAYCYVTARPTSIALGDLNRDGRLDIVVPDNGNILTSDDGNGDVSVLLGLGDATFAPQVRYPLSTHTLSVALGDLNGDGWLDIVGAGGGQQSIVVLPGLGGGTFPIRPSYAVGTYPSSVAVGDMNGDHRLDVVVANSDDNTVSLLLGQAGGTFGPQATYAVGDSPRSVALADLNGDGRLDIVTANFLTDNVSVLLQVMGGFTVPGTYAVGDGPFSMALGDLNGDGRLDIVTANSASNLSGNFSVLMGQEGGTFAPQATYAGGFVPDSMALGDVNGDGRLDIVAGHPMYGNTGGVSVLLGQADGTFTPPLTFELEGFRLWSIALGDVNADGRLDIVGADFGPDRVAVLLGVEGGALGAPATYAARGNPTALALADLNGDGRLDIVTANEITCDVSVLMGQEGGTFAPQATYAVGWQPESVALGDVNGDGRLDVVTANYYSDDISVLLNLTRYSHQPSGPTSGPVDAVRFRFSQDMDQTSFDPAVDVVEFAGPEGPLSVTGYAWLDPRILEVRFAPQTTPGDYHMKVGPNILDLSGRAMDADRDGVPGESPDDQYTATFTITGLLNHAPVLDPIGNKSIDEQLTLSFTALATDQDDPAQTLTFSLDPAAIAWGMSIDPATGAFSWTPTEAQGGSSYPATITVTDDGTPNLSDSETITITVNEVNVAPVLALIGDRAVDEQATVTFTVSATDQDDPSQTLTYNLDPAAIALGMSIDPTTGVFSWTPTEAQGGSSYPATITLTDNGTPNLSDSETVTITVNEVNVAPVLAPVGNKTVDEQGTLTFTASAADQDDPAQTLTYSLDPAAIALGMSIDAATGVFTWTPMETQGMQSYPATITVRDNGTNPASLTDSEQITIAVNEVNAAPVLAPIGDKAVDEEATLTFTASATDQDDPAQTLIYSLDPEAIALGMSIDPMTGVFIWTPALGDAGSYSATITVTDSGINPANLTDQETITITVSEVVSLSPAKAGYSLLLRVNPKDPQQVELVNARSTKTQYWTGPVNQTYGLTIKGLDNKSDTLTVDTANGPLTNLRQVFFDAKGGGEKIVDRLVIKNSAKNAPATNESVEVLADRMVFNGTAYLTEALESVSVDTGKGDDTIVVSALGTNITLIDSGGTDTLHFSQAGAGVTIDLNKAGGQAQKVFAPDDPNTLALKGTFENVTGTAQADILKGNAAANLIYGLGGDDTIYGGAGNDALYGGEGNDWLYGDAGNDILQGGPGNNVLLGGAGNDVLDVNVDVTAGTGRNLLIGGAGLDSLQGGLGEEILIGSTTKYDGKPLALAAIMEEWASDTPFLQRQAHLTDGFTVPGNPKLGLIQLVPKDKTHPRGTVFDDRTVDQLLGGLGDDWFFPFGIELPNDS